jgi:hypothetical protein
MLKELIIAPLEDERRLVALLRNPSKLAYFLPPEIAGYDKF